MLVLVKAGYEKRYIKQRAEMRDCVGNLRGSKKRSWVFLFVCMHTLLIIIWGLENISVVS